jgi:hypothetical protein
MKTPKTVIQTHETFSTYTAKIVIGNSITVTRENEKPNTFVIGDWAECDSYNLSYTGIIRSITEKTVTVEEYPGTSMARKYRLKIGEFCWRNWDFNIGETQKRNSETMMYI